MSMWGGTWNRPRVRRAAIAAGSARHATAEIRRKSSRFFIGEQLPRERGVRRVDVHLHGGNRRGAAIPDDAERTEDQLSSRETRTARVGILEPSLGDVAHGSHRVVGHALQAHDEQRLGLDSTALSFGRTVSPRHRGMPVAGSLSTDHAAPTASAPLSSSRAYARART
jgi:hypothetical protein